MYRKLRPQESGIYRTLRLESLYRFPDHYGSTFEREQAQARLPYEEYIEREAAGKFVTGAFSGEQLVGICAFFQQEAPRFRHRGAIIQMYVRPDQQGRGLGRGLLDATMREAFTRPGLEQILLDVVSDNARAIRLYQKAGFRLYGRLPNYLKREDGYLDLLEFVRFRTA